MEKTKTNRIMQLIKAWKERTGESYSYLARQLHTNQQNVSRWVNGVALPSEEHILALLSIIAPDEDARFFVGGDSVSEKIPVFESSRFDLPLEQLSSEDFERFCRRLAELKGHDGARRLGVSGDAQEGIDIYCEKTRTVIQCKQTKVAKGYSGSSVKGVVEKYNNNLDKLETMIGFKPERKILAVTTPGVSAKGITILRKENWEHFSLEELTSTVRGLSTVQKEELVTTFFPDNPRVLEKCLGIEPASPFIDAIKYYDANLASRICPLNTEYIEFENDPVEIIQDKIMNSKKTERDIKSKFLLLEGNMGSGKSRVLKEFSNLRQEGTYIVSIGEVITETSLRGLLGDNVVIVDCGEDAIVVLPQLLNSILSIVAKDLGASIPFVVVAVTPEITGQVEQLFISRNMEPPEIIRMPKMLIEGQKKLLRNILGGRPQCEDYLIEVSDDNLVFLVKIASLLKGGEKNLLEFSQDNIVKRISKKYIDDNINNLFEQGKDKRDCRTILKTISLLEPFRDDTDFLNIIKSFDIEQRQAQKIIRKLKRAGVLRTFAGSIWIRPILLGDCICNEALSEFDKEELIKIEPVYRFNILRNIGRLGISTDNNVIARTKNSIWQTLEDDFEKGDASERKTILQKVRDISYLYPEDTMNLVDYAVAHIAKASKSIWGETTQKDVLEAIPSILEGVYYNIESAERPIRLLVDLANKNQSRYGDNPLEILKRIVKPDLRKSVSFQEEAVEIIIRLIDPGAAADWVFNTLLGALSISETSSSWHLHTVSLEHFYVDPKKVEKLHKMILSYYFASVYAISAAGFTPVAVIKAICQQLRMVTNDRLWSNERKYILKRLEEVLNDKNIPILTKALFYEEIKYKGAHIKKSFEAFEDEPEFMIYRAILDGDSYSTFGKPYEKNSYERYAKWLDKLTDLLLKKNSTNFSYLLDMIEKAMSISTPYAGRIVIEKLCKKSSVFCRELIEKSLADNAKNEGLQTNLYLAIDCLLTDDIDYVLEQIDHCLESDEKAILNSIATIMPKMSGEVTPEHFGALLEKLVKKADESAIETLMFSAIRPEICDLEIVKEIMKTVLLSNNPRFTYRLLSLFERRYGRVKVEELSEGEIETIVNHMILLDDLDYRTIDFLGSVAARMPKKVIDVFIGRMMRREAERDYNFTVVPYSCKIVFPEESKEELLEYLLAWLKGHASSMVAELYWTKVAKILSLNEKTIFNKIHALLNAELGKEELKIVDRLISALPTHCLWNYEDEIEQVLRKAQTTAYPNILDTLRGSFVGITRSGSKMRSVGAPCARDIELRDKSQAMLDKLPYDHLSKDIYLSMNKYAKYDIEYDRREDEDEGIRWDDED